jgi:hypothetical protein
MSTPTPKKPLSMLVIDSPATSSLQVNMKEEQAKSDAAQAALVKPNPAAEQTTDLLTGVPEIPVDAPVVKLKEPAAPLPKDEPAAVQSAGGLTLSQLLVKVDEHVTNLKTKLAAYAGKQGFNPYFAATELVKKHDALKRLVAKGEVSEAMLKEAALELLNTPFVVPSTEGRKFEPQPEY